jgi:RNA polymerase sigma factor (sigma-70 family)
MTFDELLKQYEPFLLKVCHAWHRPSMFDDLYQVASLEMWRRWHVYDPSKGSFLNYLFTHVPGKVRDYVRANEEVVRTPVHKWNKNEFAEIIRFDAAPHLMDLVTAEEVSTDDGLNVDEADSIHAAVERLKPKLCEAVKGYYFRNLTVAALAQELGITHQGVSLRLKTALSLLRKTTSSELQTSC